MAGVNEKIMPAPGVSAGRGVTWPQVLQQRYQRHGNRHLAMRAKHYGIWRPITWEDYYLQVKYLALGLNSLGFKKGDKLLIIGDNAPQWNYAVLAAQADQGLSIGMYPDLTAPEIAAIARKTEARFAIVEDQEQVDKFLQLKNELPGLEKVIYWRYKGLAGYCEPLLAGLRQVLESGHEYEQRHPDTFEEHVASGKAEDMCAVIYTSGATGEPKGAVHTYASTFAGAQYLLDLDSLREDENIACFLPPVWMLEYVIGIGCHLLSGSVLNFAEEVETQQQDLREIGPDLVYYSARQWESQAGAVQARIQGADALKRLAYRWFINVGNRLADHRRRGERPGLLLRTAGALGNVCLFRPIRDTLGLPATRICYTSGAVLSPDAFRFYHALGIPLKTIYGTTEGGILSGDPAGDIQPGTAGKVAPNVEVGIREDGEIVYRQDAMFRGYYGEPERTAEVLRGGWFSSGDAGTLSEEGRILFIDRKNDLIHLSDGETLAPQFIESRLKYSPFVKDAWVMAEPDGPGVAAVIVIDYTNVGKWAGKKRLAYTTFTDLSQKPAVYELIEQTISAINADLSPGSRVYRFVNLHKEFDPDEGELTRDRKLRRDFLKLRYEDLTTALFSGTGAVTLNVRIQYRDGRTGTMRTTLNIAEVREAAP